MDSASKESKNSSDTSAEVPSMNDDYILESLDRLMSMHAQGLSVVCPTCKAKMGDDCVNVGVMHAERVAQGRQVRQSKG